MTRKEYVACNGMSERTEEPARAPETPLFFLAAKNEDRRTAVLFCRSARPRTPFFGGTIDDKKGMRGHRMGCQN